MADTFWLLLWMTPPCMSRPSMPRACGRSWMTAPPAVYAAGHLFYSRQAGVFARPFDAGRLEFSGAEMQVTERAGEVSVSDHGTIAYRPVGASVSTLTWFDHSGRHTGTLGKSEPYDQVVLSPRGRHVTVVRGDAGGMGRTSGTWTSRAGSSRG